MLSLTSKYVLVTKKPPKDMLIIKVQQLRSFCGGSNWFSIQTNPELRSK